MQKIIPAPPAHPCAPSRSNRLTTVHVNLPFCYLSSLHKFRQQVETTVQAALLHMEDVSARSRRVLARLKVQLTTAAASKEQAGLAVSVCRCVFIRHQNKHGSVAICYGGLIWQHRPGPKKAFRDVKVVIQEPCFTGDPISTDGEQEAGPGSFLL